MKTKSLAFKFGVIFTIFALITIVISGIMTYLSQTETYHQECKNLLKQISAAIINRINDEGDEFRVLKEYFEEHMDEIELSKDFKNDQYRARDEFYAYITENFPEETLKYDPDFTVLDEKGKLLYVTWRMEYWFSVFFEMADDFGLSYVYFIYPTDEEAFKVRYMFDATLGTRITEDGKEVLFLGDEVREDPIDHLALWSAWKLGRPVESFDTSDNVYGFVYSYSVPLIINDEKIGIICTDIDVEGVKSTIMTNAAAQMGVLAAILLVSVLLLYSFIRRHVLRRVVMLEKNVKDYSENKDRALAEKIRSNVKREDEIASLSNRFANMIEELEDYMKDLQAVTAEKERIGAELHVATQIQADMLPRIFPPFPDRPEVDIFATMTPAKEVGGDFYDFFMVDDTHLAMVIADVSSKGVPAALFMVIAKTLIKNCAQNGNDIAEVFYSVNNQLCEGNEESMFVTAFMAVVDITSGELTYVNAGHEPFLLRHDGEWQWIHPDAGFILAGLPDFEYKSENMQLYPSDRLFFFTDGVSESQNIERTLFGEDRILDTVRRNGDKDLTGMLTSIRKDIDSFAGEAPQFDDITMLVFEFCGKDKK
ncbi:MAG: PP2C family protein-serine/threonine phosphatase [Lachnospiraceae bacterium]|nr:PP2C family protein-serine/threonine phosphatase [Lachnospiraceae bacterium]